MRLFVLTLTGFMVLVMSGCYSTPRSHASCLAPAPQTVMLLLERPGQNAQRLLLHTESGASRRVWVALDTLGAPQFSASQQDDQLQVDASALYREIRPQELLWGYQWWLMRDDENAAQRCAELSGYNFRQSRGFTEVYAGRHLNWQWHAENPQVFSLPRQQVSVRVQVLE